MKTMMTAMAAITLAMGLAACSEQASETTTSSATETASLAGTWKWDAASSEAENADLTAVLAEGEYTCESCIPPYTIPADGDWHDIEQPGISSTMVKIVDDRTIEYAYRFEDTEIRRGTWMVEEDGKTMKLERVDLAGAEPVTTVIVFNRNAEGPEDAHAVSGTWQPEGIESASEAALISEYTIDGDSVTYVGNDGRYTAILGGEPVAVEGSTDGTMVAIEQTGPNTYKETYTFDGEVVSTLDMTVDGDTLNFVATDARTGAVYRSSAKRQ